jgi:hypothetical protein
MIRIRQTLLSAVSLIKHFGLAVRAFVHGKLASARDRRLFSRMNQRELRELGLDWNKDKGTYDHLP